MSSPLSRLLAALTEARAALRDLPPELSYRLGSRAVARALAAAEAEARALERPDGSVGPPLERSSRGGS